MRKLSPLTTVVFAFALTGGIVERATSQNVDPAKSIGRNPAKAVE